MVSLLVLFFVVMLVIYTLSQLMDEPITEPDVASRCPHCDARIRLGRRSCHACGERLG